MRTDLIVCTVRLPRARCALAMTGKATLIVIARLAEQAVAIPCRNYQLRTNLFVFSVCRCAVGWGMPHPYNRLSKTNCRAGACPRRLQELPTLYKPVRLYRLPLRGRWTHVSTLQNVYVRWL